MKCHKTFFLEVILPPGQGQKPEAGVAPEGAANLLAGVRTRREARISAYVTWEGPWALWSDEVVGNVVGEWQKAHLSSLPEFEGLVPAPDSMALALARKLLSRLPDLTFAVTVHEVGDKEWAKCVAGRGEEE